MTKTSMDLESIKAGIAQQFSRIDQALSDLNGMIRPEPECHNLGIHTDDPRFALVVSPGDHQDWPIVIEMREVGPNPKLVGFVELTRMDTFNLIDLLADRIGLNAYLSQKGNA